MRNLNVGFFIIYVGGLATLVSIRAIKLWQGRMNVFDSSVTPQNLEARPSEFVNFRRWLGAPLPSGALAVWGFLLSTLAIHYSEISGNHVLKFNLLAIGWLLGAFAMIFFALGLMISLFGWPKFLIPPPLREMK